MTFCPQVIILITSSRSAINDSISKLISYSVSQFTLYGILKGNKPDFHVAMPPAKAKPFYASLVEKFQRSYSADSVKGKIFICHPELLIIK